MTHRLKAMCHTDGQLWSAREIASMALPAARERHAKNVLHIALIHSIIEFYIRYNSVPTLIDTCRHDDGMVAARAMAHAGMCLSG